MFLTELCLYITTHCLRVVFALIFVVREFSSSIPAQGRKNKILIFCIFFLWNSRFYLSYIWGAYNRASRPVPRPPKIYLPWRPGRRRGRRAGEINTSQLPGQTTPTPSSTPAPGQTTPAHSSSPAPLSTPAAPGQTTKRRSRGTIIPREGVIIE